MMRISDSCRRSDAGREESGFSLLELLIVLVLLSAVVAVVAPRLAGTVRAIGSSGDRAEVVRQVRNLPLQARNEGKAIRFARGEALGDRSFLQLPEGWRLEALDAVEIAANGVCAPFRIRAQHDDLTEDWAFAAPDCRMESDDL